MPQPDDEDLAAGVVGGAGETPEAAGEKPPCVTGAAGDGDGEVDGDGDDAPMCGTDAVPVGGCVVDGPGEGEGFVAGIDATGDGEGVPVWVAGAGVDVIGAAGAGDEDGVAGVDDALDVKTPVLACSMRLRDHGNCSDAVEKICSTFCSTLHGSKLAVCMGRSAKELAARIPEVATCASDG